LKRAGPRQGGNTAANTLRSLSNCILRYALSADLAVLLLLIKFTFVNLGMSGSNIAYKLEGELNKLFNEALLEIFIDDALIQDIKKALVKNSANVDLIYRVYSKLYKIDDEDEGSIRRRNIPLLSVILEECEAVHLHYKENLSDSSKLILEQQLSNKLFPDNTSKENRVFFGEDIKALEREMIRFVYGMFATFGTGAAVYLAFNLFTDWPMEHKLIASILMSCAVSIFELIRFIKCS
jgi:hypothetical protein